MRSIVIIALAISTSCYSLNFEKLNVTQARLRNITGQPIAITTSYVFNSDRAPIEYQEVPLSIDPSKEVSLMLDSTQIPHKTSKLSAIIDQETRQSLHVDITTDGHNKWYVDILETAPEYKPFSFTPSMVDFDTGLSIRTHEVPFPSRIKNLAKEYITNPLPYTVIIDKFRALYDKHKLGNVHPSQTRTIPKIIHQIWVSNPMPEKYKKYIASWLKKHPTWQYILWTDREQDPCPEFAQNFANYTTQSLASFGILKNQILYDNAKNPAQKSDLFRYELLAKQGGVYIDCDVECFEPLDILHHTYHFYAGIEPMECGRLVGNAIIGAKPNHPIIEECVKTVTSPEKCTQARRYGSTMTIVCATGPIVLTGAAYRKANQNNNIDILFPTSYFYPCGLRKPQASPKPESFAAHYWTLAWAGMKR